MTPDLVKQAILVFLPNVEIRGYVDKLIRMTINIFKSISKKCLLQSFFFFFKSRTMP